MAHRQFVSVKQEYIILPILFLTQQVYAQSDIVNKCSFVTV